MPIIKRAHAGMFEVRLSVAPGNPPIWYVKVWLANGSSLFLGGQFRVRSLADDIYESWSAIVRSNMMAPMGAIEMRNAMYDAMAELGWS
jgi:hypothetical protein